MTKKIQQTKIIRDRIDGILLVNKPLGLTSNGILQRVKHLYNAKKAGHTGSLDPLATGMLPICFGEATKFCQYLLDADKCYEVTGMLGIKTTTGDAEGEVISSTEDFVISREQIEAVVQQFTGPIMQIPSMFSALKHEGTALYHYARAGIDIPRPARPVTIYSIEIKSFDGVNLSLIVRCSKGTYIRNLIEDMGSALNVGAHVTHLHRSYTAGFECEHYYDWDSLEAMSSTERMNCLLPMERAIAQFPVFTITGEERQKLQQGKSLIPEQPIVEPAAIHRLYDDEHQFIGLGMFNEEGYLTVKRLLSYS